MREVKLVVATYEYYDDGSDGDDGDDGNVEEVMMIPIDTIEGNEMFFAEAVTEIKEGMMEVMMSRDACEGDDMVFAEAPFSIATEVAAAAATFDATTLDVIGGESVAAFIVVLSLSDPEKRRQVQAEEVDGGDNEVVREYFNNIRFQQWRKIYGEMDQVNRVQMDIRIRHSKIVENVMQMLTDEGPLEGVTMCDASCGTIDSASEAGRIGAGQQYI
ncbi:hypothetical protein RJ640_007022 [Escallonia rubra]|uniref:Uncharacterized protein n=1 Tax=Escallonia rubra TaxID=112253 RepID=A0AA88RFE1_9ASTE|nr:hypothetical protein RJ640_007022 [Escallonia rubra]